MTHPTDEELEAMAELLDRNGPSHVDADIWMSDAAAMLRACKTGDASNYLDGWNDAREAAAKVAEQCDVSKTLSPTAKIAAAIRALTPPERSAPMTDTLANKLPREIARVTAKKERWQGYMRDHDMGPGMQLSINIMQAEIENAVAALSSGDVTAMLAALEALKGYNDAD
jgi:hypothetical protein